MFSQKQTDIFETELQQLPEHSGDGKFKDLKLTLKSMNAFIISLVIYFMGSRFKILRMSWYKSMKPFQDNLELVMKKYLFSWHDSFPGVDTFSNDQVLSSMSKYISF